jgi:hypothetical protein
MPIPVIDMTAESDVLRPALFDVRQHIADSVAFRQPFTEPHCGEWTPVGLVARTFHYRNDRTVTVRCHAKVMVAYLKALGEDETIEVTATSSSRFSGSYRTFDQQNDLFQDFKNHVPGSHLAADPCDGFHRTGRALDIREVTDHQAETMESVRLEGERFFWGISFGDRPHFSFGVLG